MTRYIETVMPLKFMVDLLLILGAGSLWGYPMKIRRALAGAAVGGVYAGICLLPGMYFLGNELWRSMSFGIVAIIAYGIELGALRKILVFAVLSFALEGAVICIGEGGFWGVLGAAGVICLLCCFGFRSQIGGISYVPVELYYNGKHVCLTALQDTGNTLRDPITGRQVLVIGADAALRLTGLTPAQLRCPVESVGAIPGLRLIPYHSVGNKGDFMLAIKLQNVKIGTWKGSSLVAFAPYGLSPKGEYQALTGGLV